MDELLAKISSYNIFNNLVPGALFCIGIEWMAGPILPARDLVTTILIYYASGMILSRLGSLTLGPLARPFRLKPRNSYSRFIQASRHDQKIELLLETANTYRSFTAVFVALLIVGASISSGIFRGLRFGWLICLPLALFALLFMLSYLKQVSFVDRRVGLYDKGDG